MDIDVEVLRHKDRSSPGEVLPAPAGGWVGLPARRSHLISCP
jgi:hypothetical protein